jgi:hypothetical protein
MNLVEQALEKVCTTFPTDTMPARSFRFAFVHQLLGARNWVIGSNGTLQHPEVETMQVDEYDEFIKAPYKFVVEKVIPRTCTKLGQDMTANGLMVATAYAYFKSINGALMAVAGKLSAKYGFAPGFITNQPFLAPFDFIGDHLRGVVGINKDVFRCSGKIKAATEALVPLTIKMATPPVMRPGIISFVPLHLGPFLGKKAFEELYWPSLEKIIVHLDKIGVACNLFVEHDWTRFAPYLERLPKSTMMYMEQSDPKVFADTVGKEHVFGGFYDPTISLSRTKQECIDEAKRLLDICMKTGKYYFTFDKSVIDIKSIDISKIQAVLEWVIENGKY